MLLNKSLIDGIIFNVLVLIIMIINPRYQLHNYPSAIKKAVPPKTTKEQSNLFDLLAMTG
jgi:hypothetical protein